MWRKWNRSSFDSVAECIFTGTLTRPNEIEPLQIDRMHACFPPRKARKPRKVCGR